MTPSPRLVTFRAVLHALPLSLLVAALVWHGPMAQDPSYHDFADQRHWLGVAQGQNTWSNLPFFVAGVLALIRGVMAPVNLRWPACVMGLGLLGVAVGSAWYHLAPTDQSLIWDRLPMSVAFAAALVLIGIDRFHPRARFALTPLVLLAAGSVGIWHWTGDLRAYAVVQFGSLLLMIQCLLFGQGNRLRASWIWLAIVWYVVAKGFEASDLWWWQASGQQLAGHMLKHLAAGIGSMCLALAIPIKWRHDQH
ncbi:hypothetical protein C7S18_19375 [Ahniella affigens]|uniref:Alkaline phytoceramidase n=1 Tax=Ahniella affigens TaxID=2021234 RepID=A0A2P1PWN8_9GAMM|nr:ceramidase domain-containing protein [Ahniella affigens]AVP99194.1 hypothetical protein C7S18_19375 [Ahniella affigens]